MGKIRIGLTPAEQQAEVTRYLAAHADITRIYVFAPPRFPLTLETLPDGIACEQVAYSDIIMYKVFYPLLEAIDAHTLLIFQACLRTQNRSDLTYNCAHHYANQTPHVLVFEPFPFIEDVSDVMILLDYQAPGRYKGRSFAPEMLREAGGADVQAQRRYLTIESIQLTPTARELVRYEERKAALFAGLGQGDPDTIPRQLHIAAGAVKKAALRPNLRYVARNDRYKLPNVTTYREARAADGDTLRDAILIDFPHRRLDFNDFLTVSGMTTIRFLHSGLKVDDYYLGELRAWVARLEAFYALCPTYDE